jgi:hypothetical protein
MSTSLHKADIRQRAMRPLRAKSGHIAAHAPCPLLMLLLIQLILTLMRRQACSERVVRTTI